MTDSTPACRCNEWPDDHVHCHHRGEQCCLCPCTGQPTTAARPWAKRGRKGPTVIGDEGFERDGLPHDAEDIGGGKYRDSEGGIWTVIPEAEGRWAQRGGQYRRRLRRLYERARHAD